MWTEVGRQILKNDVSLKDTPLVNLSLQDLTEEILNFSLVPLIWHKCHERQGHIMAHLNYSAGVQRTSLQGRKCEKGTMPYDRE